MANTPTTGPLHRDGFCILSDLLDDRALALARSEAAESDAEVTVWYRDECRAPLLRLMTTGAVAAALRRHLGPGAVFCSVKAVAKGLRESRPSPWHQDRPYWGGSLPKFSLWIALDDASPANGCLRVLPGSHRRLRIHRAGDEAHRFGNRLDPAEVREADAVDVPLRAGQAVLFHDLLVHASHPGRAGRSRRSLIATYRGAAQEADDHWRGRVVALAG